MQYKCPTCGDVRGSYHDMPKCNHDQDDDGVPLPVALMVPVTQEDDPPIKILSDKDTRGRHDPTR